MTMRALKQFDYFGLRKRIEKGDLFEPCSAEDAKVLALAQIAVEEEPKKSKKRYQRADLRAEE